MLHLDCKYIYTGIRAFASRHTGTHTLHTHTQTLARAHTHRHKRNTARVRAGILARTHACMCVRRCLSCCAHASKHRHTRTRAQCNRRTRTDTPWHTDAHTNTHTPRSLHRCAHAQSTPKCLLHWCACAAPRTPLRGEGAGVQVLELRQRADPAADRAGQDVRVKVAAQHRTGVSAPMRRSGAAPGLPAARREGRRTSQRGR
jgi:hypothetical protein